MRGSGLGVDWRQLTSQHVGDDSIQKSHRIDACGTGPFARATVPALAPHRSLAPGPMGMRHIVNELNAFLS